jgi:hypothetical protein
MKLTKNELKYIGLTTILAVFLIAKSTIIDSYSTDDENLFPILSEYEKSYETTSLMKSVRVTDLRKIDEEDKKLLDEQGLVPLYDYKVKTRQYVFYILPYKEGEYILSVKKD